MSITTAWNITSVNRIGLVREKLRLVKHPVWWIVSKTGPNSLPVPPVYNSILEEWPERKETSLVHFKVHDANV